MVCADLVLDKNFPNSVNDMMVDQKRHSNVPFFIVGTKVDKNLENYKYNNVRLFDDLDATDNALISDLFKRIISGIHNVAIE